MTREEAIKILNKYDLNFCDIDGYPIPPQDLADACDMAIEALEKELSVQPEIIMCKGCKHLQKWRNEESAKKFGQIYACARNVFNCPKPEDFCSHAEAYELGKADRPTGHWIDTQVDSAGLAHRRVCSICGEEPAAWSSVNKFDFCPNCGARMESEEE